TAICSGRMHTASTTRAAGEWPPSTRACCSAAPERCGAAGSAASAATTPRWPCWPNRRVDSVLPEPLDGQRPVADPAGLIDHLLHAHELDRQRLAERIHDDPMQALVAGRLGLQHLAPLLPEAEREHTNE